MNIENKYPVTIFKRTNDYGTFYSVGLSKKNMDGEYVNGYMPCKFKNGVSLDNQTRINIKKAWLDFYLKDKVTKTYIFISDFELVDKEETKEDPYANFGNSVKAEELDDLPF